MIRANIFENGRRTNGKVIGVTKEMKDFLENIRSSFGSMDISHVFTAKGGEIQDPELIR
jgi:hypothetical protein